MDNKLINRLDLQFVVDIYPPWLTDDKWIFNFKTPDEYNNTFYIENLSKTKVLRAGFDDGPVKSIQVTLEDFDKDVKGQVWIPERIYAANVKNYFLLRNSDYDGVLTPGLTEDSVLSLGNISLVCNLLICTLISANQCLGKSRSASNLRKISGPANLDFFSR